MEINEYADALIKLGTALKNEKTTGKEISDLALAIGLKLSFNLTPIETNELDHKIAFTHHWICPKCSNWGETDRKHISLGKTVATWCKKCQHAVNVKVPSEVPE